MMLELMATTLRVSVIDSYIIKVSLRLLLLLLTWTDVHPNYTRNNNNKYHSSNTLLQFSIT